MTVFASFIGESFWLGSTMQKELGEGDLMIGGRLPQRLVSQPGKVV